MNFTKKKFQKLDIFQQHKKCAFLLKKIYEVLLINNSQEETQNTYNQFIHWMNIDSFSSINLKEISNRYHYHLKHARVNLKEHNLLPSIRKNDSIKEHNFLDNAIFLDNVRSAYNVGSIIRTTEALRIGSVYFTKNTPFIDNDKVEKTSMGSSKIVKCYNDFDLSDLPRPFIGLDTSDKATSIYDFIFPETFSLFLGNEEYGVSDEILKQLDYLIEIPMLGFKNSINVACAYSIAASEISRQKIKFIT